MKFTIIQNKRNTLTPSGNFTIKRRPKCLKKIQFHPLKVNKKNTNTLQLYKYKTVTSIYSDDGTYDKSLTTVAESSDDNSDERVNVGDNSIPRNDKTKNQEYQLSSDEDDVLLTQTLLIEQRLYHQKNIEVQRALEKVKNKKKDRELKEKERIQKLEEERLKIHQNVIEAEKLWQDLSNVAEEQRLIAVR